MLAQVPNQMMNQSTAIGIGIGIWTWTANALLMVLCSVTIPRQIGIGIWIGIWVGIWTTWTANANAFLVLLCSVTIPRQTEGVAPWFQPPTSATPKTLALGEAVQW